MPVIGFLHTSSVHLPTFDQLVTAVDPAMGTVALVRESLLASARRDGLGHRDVRAAVRAAVAELQQQGVGVVVCTCSTIGGLAEAAGRSLGLDLVRVDRPMAEEAVRLASAGVGRIVVVAALESTVAPTIELVESVAVRRGVDLVVEVALSEGAWTMFEAGDLEAYLDAIAQTCVQRSEGADVVVLAQASMAEVALRVSSPVPVLASPPSAVAAAFSILAAREPAIGGVDLRS